MIDQRLKDWRKEAEMMNGARPRRSGLEGYPMVLQSPASGAWPAQAVQSFQEGLSLLGSGEPEQAATAFSRSVEQAPGFTAGHVGLGIAYAMTNRIYPSLDHLEWATRLEPDSFYPHFALAQLNFKLRIPEKGYAEATCALSCAVAPQERRMIAQLLREERARERNGIARPTFNRSFSRPAVFISCTGLAIAMVVLIAFLR